MTPLCPVRIYDVSPPSTSSWLVHADLYQLSLLHHVVFPRRCSFLAFLFACPSFVSHTLFQPQISSPPPHLDLLSRLGSSKVYRLFLIRCGYICFRSPRSELPVTLGHRSGSSFARKYRSCSPRQLNKGHAQRRWLDRKQASPLLPYLYHTSFLH